MMNMNMGRALRVAAGWCLLGLAPCAHAQSLTFFGTGAADADRVKIQIGDLDTSAATNTFHRLADVGATDFTIEFWLKPAAGNGDMASACSTGTSAGNYNWINGNIVYDRDRFNQGRAFGISLMSGRIAFGVKNASNQVLTICSATDLRDGRWHHVAVQRRISDGWLWLYVDGVLRADADGPGNDISYPDDGVPGTFCNNGSTACVNSDPYIVLGAEKHDVGAGFPSYRGGFTELRISRVLRYADNFTVPSTPFTPAVDTVALYHFDEGGGTVVNDTASAGGAPSNGLVRFTDNTATRPAWSDDSPFGAPTPPPGPSPSPGAGDGGGGAFDLLMAAVAALCLVARALRRRVSTNITTTGIL
jgi:concanavalin A-like lectin/glucanase superfamily protein